MHRRWYATSIVAIVLAAAAFAGCGSSDSNDSSQASTAADTGASSTASDSSTAAEQPRGAPIVLGTVSTCGGALAAGLGGDCPAIKAWAASVNDKGGINGHPVKLTVVDDQADPAKALAGLKELVEQERVIALVGSYSVVDPVWERYITQTGLPVVGGGSSEIPYITNPNFFPSGATGPTEAYGVAAEVKKAGKSKLALPYCAEAPICRNNSLSVKAIARDLVGDVEVVYMGAVSATQPSYTAVCLAMKEAGADSAFYNAAGDVSERLATQCSQQGFTPPQISENGAVNPVVAKAPGMEGARVVVPNVPLPDESLPSTKEFHAALARYAPELRPEDPQYNSSITNAWAGGLLFEAAARAGDLGPDSTPDDVKQALYRLRDETLGGFAPPLNFNPGRPNTDINCYFVMGVTDGKLSAPDGPEPACVPDADMPKLYGDPKYSGL